MSLYSSLLFHNLFHCFASHDSIKGKLKVFLLSHFLSPPLFIFIRNTSHLESRIVDILPYLLSPLSLPLSISLSLFLFSLNFVADFEPLESKSYRYQDAGCFTS